MAGTGYHRKVCRTWPVHRPSLTHPFRTEERFTEVLNYDVSRHDRENPLLLTSLVRDEQLKALVRRSTRPTWSLAQRAGLAGSRFEDQRDDRARHQEFNPDARLELNRERFWTPNGNIRQGGTRVAKNANLTLKHISNLADRRYIETSRRSVENGVPQRANHGMLYHHRTQTVHQPPALANTLAQGHKVHPWTLHTPQPQPYRR